MGESDHQNGNPPEDAAASQHRRTPMRWRQRPTVRQLRKDHERLLDAGAEWIQRQNIEARLPDGEVIHMGGVTLVEAFTPSTVSNLYDTLNEWQRRSARRDSDLVADLERSRGGGAIHWASLGMVRQPEASSTERTHQDLPPGVQAVWLKLTYLMPSVALVCATFMSS
jgi:hypothetical protein